VPRGVVPRGVVPRGVVPRTRRWQGTYRIMRERPGRAQAHLEDRPPATETTAPPNLYLTEQGH